MKKIILLALSGLLINFSCKKDNTPPPTPSDVHLNSGLLVYFPFDGNMADSSGNGNTSLAVGGAALTYDEHGNPNSAFGGTGNGERILVTNNGSIKLDTAFSLSFDVMLRKPGRYGLVEFVDNTNAYSYSFGAGTNSLSPNNLDFIVASDSTATCGAPLEVSQTFGDSAALVPAVESWYNLVFIYHKGTLQTYSNGTLISSKSGGSSSISLCPTAKMIIGGWWDGDPASIDGKLDEIRLYNRVLNADELAELSKNFQ